MTNIALPNQVFSSPYYGGQPNGQPVNSPYPPSHSPAPAGTMGPPSKPPPSDKPTDMNELSDVLTGAGVDLKEEEAALTGRYNAPNQYQDTSFNSVLSNSFGSNGSGGGAYVPNGAYNQYSQNVPGDRTSFYGAGTFNQPTQPYQDPEVRAAEERAKALRRKAERKQYHMNDPFLFGGTLHRRLEKQARSVQVMISQAGLIKPENSRKSTQMIVAGPDKQEMLSTLTSQPLLALDAPLTEMLTLLSLATQERIRGFVEDAAAIARGRRIGSNGIVPADLKDLAVGDGVAEEVDALPTPGNSVKSPKSAPLKSTHASTHRSLHLSPVLIKNHRIILLSKRPSYSYLAPTCKDPPIPQSRCRRPPENRPRRPPRRRSPQRKARPPRHCRDPSQRRHRSHAFRLRLRSSHPQ